MIDVGIKFEELQKQLVTLEANAKRLPQKFQNAIKGHEGKMANRALEQLTREPGKPVHPIRWASRKQQRAYFASGGFGKGIPSRRTGKLLAAWRVVYVPGKEINRLILTNDDPAMPYVQGEFAQPFHKDTGWVQVGDVIDDFLRETEGVVVGVWKGTASELL